MCQSPKFLVASISDLPDVINCQFRELAPALLGPVHSLSPDASAALPLGSMEAKHRVGKLCVDLLTELRLSKDGNEEIYTPLKEVEALRTTSEPQAALIVVCTCINIDMDRFVITTSAWLAALQRVNL